MAAEDGGTHHLVRINRIQLALVPLGAAGWGLARSWRGALVFAAGGAASLLFWNLHRWVVTGMLTPSVRRRWLFGFLVLAKLALIVLLLRGMMVCFPSEVLPFVTGILLFSVSIVLEALWLIFRPD
ncbi:ATP synthase subunit I [Geothrix sp. 21YS21S-2]|uniref:ATP synthase subunit I n=1 Tax=Geothrix sp. 21YS21S-2 TaxID=3068893 RepID=UPI0027B925D8|nr:ATP synthase subunit I [Geothrix sp. 21YS21S-2]